MPVFTFLEEYENTKKILEKSGKLSSHVMAQEGSRVPMEATRGQESGKVRSIIPFP
jgi:hypothetical protein